MGRLEGGGDDNTDTNQTRERKEDSNIIMSNFKPFTHSQSDSLSVENILKMSKAKKKASIFLAPKYVKSCF